MKRTLLALAAAAALTLPALPALAQTFPIYAPTGNSAWRVDAFTMTSADCDRFGADAAAFGKVPTTSGGTTGYGTPAQIWAAQCRDAFLSGGFGFIARPAGDGKTFTSGIGYGVASKRSATEYLVLAVDGSGLYGTVPGLREALKAKAAALGGQVGVTVPVFVPLP